jgi:opacity protein-like surface antigen
MGSRSRAALMALAASLLAGRAAAEPDGAAAGGAGDPDSRLSVWAEGIGGGFRKDTLRAGLSLGGGYGVLAFGGRDRHHLLLSTADLGWIFSDRLRAIPGNLEADLELFGAEQVDPDFRQVFGGAAQLRYDFALGSRLVPFLLFGLGLSETDIYGRDLSTLFEFAVEVGAGAHWFLSERTAFTGEWRWFHLSNASIELPNHGTNTQVLLLGVSFFF